MKRILLILILVSPVLAFGQDGGIRFDQSSWAQVKAEAKTANKYIFVDCYATWCGPCKQMDNQVYPLPEVGEFMNSDFISVKMQLDTSAKDNQEIKDHYADAHNVIKQYQVTVLPTFLFFSPDGDLVQKGTGYLAAADFIKLAKDALDPEKLKYYSTLKSYQAGRKDYLIMAALVMKTDEFGDHELAKKIALDYKQNYLDHANERILSSKENLDIISKFPDLITGSGDKYFILFYKHPELADSIYKHPGYSKSFVSWVIQREEIDEKLFIAGKPLTMEPDWQRIATAIKIKYNQKYADALVTTGARLAFYRKSDQWEKWASKINELMKKHPLKVDGHDFANATMTGMIFQRDDWNLNTAAWDVFQHCKNRKVMEMALRWSELSIPLNPDYKEKGPYVQYLDTKANLLYKLGRTKEAINTEQEAVKADKPTGAFSAEYQATIQKMKDGNPTW